MSENPEKGKRRLSVNEFKKENFKTFLPAEKILKTGVNNDVESPTDTFNRTSKRISFSRTNVVKEFKVCETNGTIWGQSYEKTDGVTVASLESTEHVSDSPTDGISLFADIKDVVDGNVSTDVAISLFADISDEVDENVEMMKLQQRRESVIQGSVLKDVNRTILMNQTCDVSKANATLTGSMLELKNMSVVNNHKRKSAENISMENSIAHSSLEKVRKINQSQMDLTSVPSRTIVMEILMNGDDDNLTHDLDVTRICDADLSVTDDFSKESLTFNNQQCPSIFSAEDSIVTNPSNKTSTTATEMRVDDQANITSIPNVCEPNINKTHIFARDNVSARIEQTVLKGNRLEENNFSQYSIANQSSSSVNVSNQSNSSVSVSNCNENSIGKIVHCVEDANNVSEPAVQSLFTNTDDHHVIEDLTVSVDINFTVHDRNTFERELQSSILKHDVETYEKDTDELLSPISSHIKYASILSDDFSYGEARDHSHIPSGSIFTNKSLCKKKHYGEKSVETLNKPNFHHKNSERMKNDDLLSGDSEKKESLIEIFEKLRHHEVRDDDFESQRAENRQDENYDKVKNISKSLIQSLNQASPAAQINDNKMSEDMSLCSTNTNLNSAVTNAVKISSRQSSELPSDCNVNTNGQKLCNTTFFNMAIDDSQVTNQFLAIADLTYPNCDPLSSTKFLPMKSLTFNCSGSPILKKSRVSSQNNTDELCNLEPEQLRKQRDMKNEFLDITNDSLSKTKPELIDESKSDDSANYETLTGAVDLNKTENQLSASNETRYQKCIRCQRSVDGNSVSFLKIEDLKELHLDFSVYGQFKGLATFAHVIEAHKKRRAATELAKQSQMDQNVEAPSWEMLWENKQKTTIAPKPEYIPEMLYCFPMRMSIEFLLKNKMTTEYKKWKYFDNYFYSGAIALRHEKIPSIRIHIKFDWKGPTKAQELNVPLTFNRVFVEECPLYLKKISPRNYLKHTHALALLPLDLTMMCSHSDDIYQALDQIDECFESAVQKVKELDLLVIECEALLKMEERQCYIEHTVIDIKKYLFQEFFIKLDKIDKVGPRNVFFEPICETTEEFKNLPVGLPFLRAFLNNTKSFLSSFIEE